MSEHLTWLGCDLVTGGIIEELPDLAPESGPIRSVLATVTSADFSLPIVLGGAARPPTAWRAATQEGRTMIVCVLHDTPTWAGPVLVVEAGTGPTARIGCVSLEGYLDRRYVGDHLWTGQDMASVIAAGLLADADPEGLGFTVDAPAMGMLRDREYRDRDDKTVLSALRELMGVDGGPEWAIELGWTDSTHTAVSKTIRVRPRIGVASTEPAAVFDSRGDSVATYRERRDYSAGQGANHIVATSTGDVDARPQSSPARDEAALGTMPRWEYRWSPSTSITSLDVLDGHADQALTLMASGARTIELVARADAYPRLGVDWRLGDDVGYDLVGHGHPDGLTGVARAIGWELDPRAGTVKPILLAPGDEVI